MTARRSEEASVRNGSATIGLGPANELPQGRHSPVPDGEIRT